jgi:hypothetical protein
LPSTRRIDPVLELYPVFEERDLRSAQPLNIYCFSGQVEPAGLQFEWFTGLKTGMPHLWQMIGLTAIEHESTLRGR